MRPSLGTVLRCLLAGGVAGAAVLLPLVVAILPLNRRWRLVDYLLSVAASAIRGFAGSRASIKRKEEAKGGAGPPPHGSRKRSRCAARLRS